MSESKKIKQLDNIKEALEKDNFLLATSFFNIDLLFRDYEKKRNNIKNTIENNSNKEAEEIYKIFGLEGDNKDFSKLLDAERKREMDANEYTVVEKNEVGAMKSQTGQLNQAINPGRKLMTYTELTNTLAYNEIFPKIFERAREKIKNNSNISIKDAIKDSMKELTEEIQNAEITEKLEEKIVEDIGGAEEFNKLGSNKEQKIKEINENFKKEYKSQIEEESKEEAENEVYEKYFKKFYNDTKKENPEISEREIVKKVDKKIEDKKNEKNSVYATEITKLTNDKINKKTAEFNNRMTIIEKQVLKNTKNQNFTENTLKRKQEKLKKRIDSFYNMANETLEKNKDRCVTFSERYKMSIMVNKLTLKKVNKEIKWGGEKNNFTKDDINNLKKKFIEEEKELENALKSGNNYNYSKPKKEKNFEKQTRLYIFALSKAYEEGKDEEAANLIKEIESNKKLEKNYYRLQFKTAVELGDVNGFNKLLEKIKFKKIDIKDFTYDGKNLLSVAAENDSLEMFKVLNNKGFEIDNNSIYTAINSENYDLLEYLVENKKIKDISRYSYNILSVAAKKGSPKRIETLLDRFESLNIYAKDIGGNSSILDVAIENGNMELVKYLFENKEINQELIISKNKDLSELTTNKELKKYLEININPMRLELIIKDKNTKVLKEYLEKNKKITINDEKLENIRDIAIEKEDFQLLNEVRKRNEKCLKDIMPNDAEEKRLFNYIINNNFTYIKDQYNKFSPDFSNFPYKNLLIFAIKTGNINSISSLIDVCNIEDLKKPINNIKFDGTEDKSITKKETIVDFAVKNKNTLLIRKLIQKKGIDINNENINLILQLIINRNGNSLLTSLIDNNKLNLNDKFNDEMTNLEYIMKNGSLDIIKTIIEHPKIDLRGNPKIFEYIRENKNLIDHEEYIEKLKNLQLKKENPEKYEKKLEEEKEKENKREKERIKKDEEEQEKMNKIFILHEGLKENNFNLQDFKKFINNEFGKLDLSTAGLSKEAKDNLLLLIAKEGKKDDLKFFKENLSFDVKNIKNSAKLNLFFLAIREGNIELVKSLVEENKNIINEPLSTGQTPLMLATEWKRESIINYLIENGANIEAKSKEDKNALYYAVKNNNLDLVNSLIEKGNSSINQKIEFADGRKQSLFFIAVEQGNEEIINLFLEQKEKLKVNFTEKNKRGETLLHYLVNKNGINAFKKLGLMEKLSHFEGFNINVQDKNGKTPLHYTIEKNGGHHLVKGLLNSNELKIDINIQDKEGRTPLHYAIIEDNSNIIQYLLEDPRINTNIKDSEGQSPLFLAAENGKDHVVEEFIKKGKIVDINEKDVTNGMSLLHYAVKNDNLDLVEEKLTNIEELDPNIKDNSGKTPLYYAINNKNEKMVKYLLNIKGIKIEKSAEDEPSPFLQAIESKNKEIISLFLNKEGLQIDFNEKDYYDGRTPIYYLIENKNEKSLNKLINKPGIDLNIKDAMDISPLFFAIKEYNQSAVDLLIEKGVKIDFNEKDFKKRNILHYAAEYNNAKLMKFLIDKGGFDINIKDDFGKTPLHYAVKNKNVELIKQLLEIEGIDLTIKDNKDRTAFDCIGKNMNFEPEDFEIINELRRRTEQQLEKKEETKLNNELKSKTKRIFKLDVKEDGSKTVDWEVDLNNVDSIITSINNGIDGFYIDSNFNKNNIEILTDIFLELIENKVENSELINYLNSIEDIGLDINTNFKKVLIEKYNLEKDYIFESLYDIKNFVEQLEKIKNGQVIDNPELENIDKKTALDTDIKKEKEENNKKSVTTNLNDKEILIDKKIDTTISTEPKTLSSNSFDKFIYEQLENKKDETAREIYNKNTKEQEKHKYNELCIDKTLEEAKKKLFKDPEKIPDDFKEICDKYFKVFLINNPDTDSVTRKLYDFYYLYEQSIKFKENRVENTSPGAIPAGYNKDGTIDTDAFKNTTVSAVSTDFHGSMNATLFFLLDSGVATFKKDEPTFVYYDMVSRKAYNSIDDFLAENKDTNVKDAGFLRLIPNLEINEKYNGKAVNCGDLVDAGSYSDEVVATFSYLEEQEKSKELKDKKIIRICGNHEITGINNKTILNSLNSKNREFTYRDILEDRVKLYYADGGVLYSHTLPDPKDLNNGIKYIEIFRQKCLDENFKGCSEDHFKELFEDFNEDEFNKLKGEIEKICNKKQKTLSPECTNLLPKYFNPLLKIHCIKMMTSTLTEAQEITVDKNNTKVINEALSKYEKCKELNFDKIEEEKISVEDILQPFNPTAGLSGNRTLDNPICNCVFGHSIMNGESKIKNPIYKNKTRTVTALDVDNGQTENGYLEGKKAKTNAFYIKFEGEGKNRKPKVAACTMDVDKDFEKLKGDNVKDLKSKVTSSFYTKAIFKNDIKPTFDQTEAQKEQKARLARIQGGEVKNDVVSVKPEVMNKKEDTKAEIKKESIKDDINSITLINELNRIQNIFANSLNEFNKLKEENESKKGNKLSAFRLYSNYAKSIENSVGKEIYDMFGLFYTVSEDFEKVLEEEIKLDFGPEEFKVYSGEKSTDQTVAKTIGRVTSYREYVASESYIKLINKIFDKAKEKVKNNECKNIKEALIMATKIVEEELKEKNRTLTQEEEKELLEKRVIALVDVIENIPKNSPNLSKNYKGAIEVNIERLKDLEKIKTKNNDEYIEAIVKYADMLYYGEGIKQNKEESAKYYKMAADLGDHTCLDNYKKLLREGIGVSLLNEEELEFYRIQKEKVAQNKKRKSIRSFKPRISSVQNETKDRDSKKELNNDEKTTIPTKNKPKLQEFRTVKDISLDVKKEEEKIKNEINTNTSKENDKYLIPENSNTIKKLKMFNDDIYIPEGEVKEEKIQKISNRLNKDKRIELNDNNEFTDFENNGARKKDMEQIGAKKKYNNKDTEISNRNEKNKERKEKTYLKMGENTNNILFASRLFNYMGYPTFNAYLSTENKPLFEKIDGNNGIGISTYYQDEKTARQFIKRNMVANFFTDIDAHLDNVMYNKKTGEVKHIDLEINEPIAMFNMKDILVGRMCRELGMRDKYILNMSNDAEMLKLCNELKVEEINENNKMSNNDYVNLIKKEYFNLQKKLFLINDEDLDFITLSNNKELNKDDSFLEEVNEFKNNIKLHQVKSFYWMYSQNNLHQLFNLSEEYEEKLHNIFNIDEFSKKINDLDIKKKKKKFFEKKEEYNNILKSISKTPEFKNFMSLANSFSKKNEKENYQNPNELFSDNKVFLENALDNSKNFDEFIDNFNTDLGLESDLYTSKKDSKKGFTFTVVDRFGNNDSKTVKNLDELTDIIYEIEFARINDKTKKDNFENLNNSLIYFIKNTDQEKFKEFLEKFKDRVEEFKLDKRSGEEVVNSFNDNFKKLAEKKGIKNFDVDIANSSIDELYRKLSQIAGIEVEIKEDKYLDEDDIEIEEEDKEEEEKEKKDKEEIERNSEENDENIEEEMEVDDLEETTQNLSTNIPPIPKKEDSKIKISKPNKNSEKSLVSEKEKMANKLVELVRKRVELKSKEKQLTSFKDKEKLKNELSNNKDKVINLIVESNLETLKEVKNILKNKINELDNARNSLKDKIDNKNKENDKDFFETLKMVTNAVEAAISKNTEKSI